MKSIVFSFLIMVGSLEVLGCQPSDVSFGEINFEQDSINPLKVRFICKLYAAGFCHFQTDSVLTEWSCPWTNYGGLPLTDTAFVNPNAPDLIYSGWHTFDSLPPDSMVYVTCEVYSRAFEDLSPMAIQVVLNFSYLAYHTGVKSAYFNAPIFAYDSVGQVLYFDPEIQYQPSDSIWATLTIPLMDCDVTSFIQFPNQYLPSSHNILTTFNPTGFLIWDSPPQTGDFEITYLVSGYRDGFFAYSMMRDMVIRVYDYPAGINNISDNGSIIKCYPNPSNGSFTVSFDNFGTGNKTVTLYDYLGQSLYTVSTNQMSIVVNANSLSTGVYIVQVNSNTKTETAKIVISQQ